MHCNSMILSIIFSVPFTGCHSSETPPIPKQPTITPMPTTISTKEIKPTIENDLASNHHIEALGEKPENTEFVRKLSAIALTYNTYYRVDDETHWAPNLCRMLMPASVHLSQSNDSKTHGQKLYSLFAKDRNSYISLQFAKEPIHIGQFVVKESWIPEEITGEKAPPR